MTTELEPREAKEKFKKIVEYCRRLREMGFGDTEVPYEYRVKLAELWEEYISELPPEVVEEEALAVIGYPQVVKLKDIPRKILEDPYFAKIIVEVYST